MTTADQTTDLRTRREAIVWEHIRNERHGKDIDAAIDAFHDGEATYDIVALDDFRPAGQEVSHPTPADVHGLLTELTTAFPDLWLEPVVWHHADDAVLIEGRTRGTHLGPFQGLAPTGRKVDVRGLVIYRFEGDRMTNETVYMDQATMLRQLGEETMDLRPPPPAA